MLSSSELWLILQQEYGHLPTSMTSSTLIQEELPRLTTCFTLAFSEVQSLDLWQTPSMLFSIECKLMSYILRLQEGTTLVFLMDLVKLPMKEHYLEVLLQMLLRSVPLLLQWLWFSTGAKRTLTTSLDLTGSIASGVQPWQLFVVLWQVCLLIWSEQDCTPWGPFLMANYHMRAPLIAWSRLLNTSATQNGWATGQLSTLEERLTTFACSWFATYLNSCWTTTMVAATIRSCGNHKNSTIKAESTTTSTTHTQMPSIKSLSTTINQIRLVWEQLILTVEKISLSSEHPRTFLCFLLPAKDGRISFAFFI